MKRNYKIQSKVWIYPGAQGAWHFARTDENTSEEIRKNFGRSLRGFGAIRVEVTLGETKWMTSIFPEKRSGTYLLPLKKDIRKKEDVFEDDTIEFSIKIL